MEQDKKEEKKPTPVQIMNEGLGNDEKFQSETFRKQKGEIKDEKIESIEKAEKEDRESSN